MMWKGKKQLPRLPFFVLPHGHKVKTCLPFPVFTVPSFGLLTCLRLNRIATDDLLPMSEFDFSFLVCEAFIKRLIMDKSKSVLQEAGTLLSYLVWENCGELRLLWLDV